MEQTRPYHWYCLLGAIVLEAGGTTLMKLSQGWGFAHAALLGLALMWAAICLSYYLLALSTTGLPVGVAFACWEGLGLTLITLSSVFILDEALSLKRLLGLFCVLTGALLVHRGTGHGDDTGATRRSGGGSGSPSRTAGTATPRDHAAPASETGLPPRRKP